MIDFFSFFKKFFGKYRELECRSTIKTSHNYNSYLIETVSYIELNEKSKAVKPLLFELSSFREQKL